MAAAFAVCGMQGTTTTPGAKVVAAEVQQQPLPVRTLMATKAARVPARAAAAVATAVAAAAAAKAAEEVPTSLLGCRSWSAA